MEAHDIYLIRMYIALVNDDIRQGMLSGPDYNTTQHLNQRGDTEDEKWDSPAAYRARWMLCQPFVEAWGNTDQADPEGCRLRNQHLADAGLLMTDAQYQRGRELYTKKSWNGRGGYGLFTLEDAAEEEQFDRRLDQIGQTFVDAVGAAVWRLHSEGVVREVCGRGPARAGDRARAGLLPDGGRSRDHLDPAGRAWERGLLAEDGIRGVGNRDGEAAPFS